MKYTSWISNRRHHHCSWPLATVLTTSVIARLTFAPIFRPGGQCPWSFESRDTVDRRHCRLLLFGWQITMVMGPDCRVRLLRQSPRLRSEHADKKSPSRAPAPLSVVFGGSPIPLTRIGRGELGPVAEATSTATSIAMSTSPSATSTRPTTSAVTTATAKGPANGSVNRSLDQRGR